MLLSKKYRLKDGSIYWHKLYYSMVPSFMTKYSPPGASGNYAYFLIRPHKYLEDLYNNARYFIQRGYRGYSDRDVWSIDWFLTGIMPKMLRQLKQTSHGHPIGMGPKLWRNKLEKMAQTFEIGRMIEEYDFDPRDRYACDKLKRVFERRMQDFVKYFFSLWD
jgi:hypothetical protein